MSPLTWALEVYRGDSFDEAFRLRDEDPTQLFTLTGMTGTAQIRMFRASEAIAATLTVTLMDQAEVPGGFVISMTPAVTASLTEGSYVWDVQFANAGGTVVETHITGPVSVTGDVTR